MIVKASNNYQAIRKHWINAPATYYILLLSLLSLALSHVFFSLSFWGSWALEIARWLPREGFSFPCLSGILSVTHVSMASVSVLFIPPFLSVTVSLSICLFNTYSVLHGSFVILSLACPLVVRTAQRAMEIAMESKWSIAKDATTAVHSLSFDW